ncbi:MAG: DsrE family protein [Halieaceae bacterium]|jgi:tRNA 2-thiouridine synthesizing protein C|nr:DsrE family protein [Halieaceae bacterium]
MPSQETLVRIAAAPYAGTRARAGLDAALAFAAFGQPPAVLLSGPGVLALPPRQANSSHGTPSLRKVLDSLPLYDIDTLWVCAASLERHGLADLELPAYAARADSALLRRLLSEASAVLSF